MGELSPYEDDKKKEFFAELERQRPDLMNPEAFTDKQRKAIANEFRETRVKTGMLSSIPMRCEGPDCPYAQSCPLQQDDIAPIGKKCPIEQSIVNQFFHDYVEELDVDVSRMVEVSLVRDLVDQEVQHMRKTWLLSQEHFIQEAVVGLDADGRVVTAKELHKAVEYEDKILRRKEKLRNALLATRESKAKSGQANVDSAQVMANLLQEVRQVELEREKALKKKLGLEIHDEYIDAQVVEDDEEE